MGKLSREEIEKAVARQLPGFRLSTGRAATSAFDAGSVVESAEYHLPELTTLKRRWSKYRYVGPAPGSSDDIGAAAGGPTDHGAAPIHEIAPATPESLRNLGDRFIQVVPEATPADADDDASAAKGYILDEEGRIMGAQG